jgi:integrase
VVDLGRDDRGQRKQKWHSGYRTKRDAERALVEILGRLEKGTYVEPTRQDLATYLREWLPAVRRTVRSGTWNSYRTNMELHVIPRIGTVPVQRLGAEHLNGLYAELLERGRCDGRGGLSPRTVRYTHTILHRALRDAVRWGRLPRNVADLADAPRSKAPEIQTWHQEELKRFLDHIVADRLYAAWLLLATTGLRRGELLGLSWQDVDLDAGRIVIRHALMSVGGKLSVSAPKTSKSRRGLSLDATTTAALRAHRGRQLQERLAWGPDYQDAGFVFCREDGTPVRPDSFSRRFQTLAGTAGLPVIRVHDVRHTYASIALTAGTHPKVVADRLGHSTIGTTLDTYSHVVQSLEEHAAARVACVILGGSA